MKVHILFSMFPVPSDDRRMCACLHFRQTIITTPHKSGWVPDANHCVRRCDCEETRENRPHEIRDEGSQKLKA